MCMDKNRSFIKFLIEAPISDYKTIGNFDKAHSFRDRRDRTLVTNPRSIERTYKKFDNSDMDFNFIFVNKPGAGKFMEVGRVDISYVQKNLGDDVANAVREAQNKTEDSVTIIFTNNSGDEKIPMTPWIIAHRIGHALAREGSSRSSYYYKEASDYLISGMSEIIKLYGVREFPDKEDTISKRTNRDSQLLMKNFFQQVATFRSAREGIIRDWFEVFNELIAQYLTTGKIRFNDAPKSFKSNRTSYFCKDLEEANAMVERLANTMEYTIDAMLHTTHNNIYVM